MAEMGDRAGTPEAIDVIKMPEAPRVASRTSPGTVPMKVS